MRPAIFRAAGSANGRRDRCECFENQSGWREGEDMAEIRTIRYDDGRWCEQQYVDGKLHGNWTVFLANGQKEWERQHARARKEGYFRRWDEAARLIEEQWYHLDELHGCWRRWDEEGQEEVVGDFYFGYPRQ